VFLPLVVVVLVAAVCIRQLPLLSSCVAHFPAPLPRSPRRMAVSVLITRDVKYFPIYYITKSTF
jgi:hypothetical protein